MFDVAPTELIVLGTVALLVIPPKDLPRAMRTAGYWIGRARGVARQFRSGFDSMVRDAELAEMEKRWKAENERIMREHPPTRTEDAGSPEPGSGEDVAPAMVDRPLLTEMPTGAEVESGAVSAPGAPAVAAESPTVVPADLHAAPAADSKVPS